jgi:hypothetical protein
MTELKRHFMANKIFIVSLLLLCVTILSLVIAGKDNQKAEVPVAASEPNHPASVPDTEKAVPDSPAQDQQPSDANNTSSEDQDEPELPAESPLPSFYSFCQAVYDLCVNDDGNVDYALLRRKRSDLLSALKILETIHPAQIMAMDDAEKQAFWINTYNLCTMKLIIDNYPIKPKWYMILYPTNSIMQITNPWTKNYFKIQGLEYNLQEIERELLLERFGDPRICFALSNSTRGGALLRKEIYQSQTLDDQLDEQVRKYLAGPHGLKWDNEKNTLYISNLFNMYRDIFLKSSYAKIKKFRQRKDDERVWLNFIITYLSAEQINLLESSDYTLQFIDYDWNLNEFSSP